MVGCGCNQWNGMEDADALARNPGGHVPVLDIAEYLAVAPDPCLEPLLDGPMATSGAGAYRARYLN